jgi:hypothetical protein
MTDECGHHTLHGPTSAGTWVCNLCGFEVMTGLEESPGWDDPARPENTPLNWREHDP